VEDGYVQATTGDTEKEHWLAQKTKRIVTNDETVEMIKELCSGMNKKFSES
jgi:hypothetical protein